MAICSRTTSPSTRPRSTATIQLELRGWIGVVPRASVTLTLDASNEADPMRALRAVVAAHYSCGVRNVGEMRLAGVNVPLSTTRDLLNLEDGDVVEVVAPQPPGTSVPDLSRPSLE